MSDKKIRSDLWGRTGELAIRPLAFVFGPSPHGFLIRNAVPDDPVPQILKVVFMRDTDRSVSGDTSLSCLRQVMSLGQVKRRFAASIVATVA